MLRARTRCPRRRASGNGAPLRLALLRGREHVELGAIDVVAEGSAAIAISLGGAPKRYAHVDPNEDAALLALGAGGRARRGRRRPPRLRGRRGRARVPRDPPGAPLDRAGHGRAPTPGARQAGAVLEDANRAIRAERDGSRTGPCTTLAFALVLPGGGRAPLRRRSATATSTASATTARCATSRRSPDAKPFFLGQSEADAALLARAGARSASAPLAGARAARARDRRPHRARHRRRRPRGGGARGGRRARRRRRRRAAPSRPRAACSSAPAPPTAAARSGDNVACAVVWL